MNLLPKHLIKLRSLFITQIRRFMEQNGFLELDTPILKKIPGMEPYLDPFLVQSPDGKEKGYLITSPEYSLKMVLSTGIPKIYEITHTFRSGEKGSPIHTAEFLMLEWYAADTTEHQTMDIVLDLLYYLNKNFYPFGMEKLPIQKISNHELFYQHTKRGWRREELVETLHENKIPIPDNPRYEDLFYLVFFNCIENLLPKGLLFLYDYPPECAALSKIEAGVARRFELYWDGIELANSFYELTDSIEQKRRLEEERKLRKELGKEAFPLDEDFLSCLEEGIPEACGISIGLDRLLMKILNASSLQEISPYFNKLI